MADQDKVVVDEQGHPRFFSFERAAASPGLTAVAADGVLTGATPQESAQKFLAANASVLGLGLAAPATDTFSMAPAIAPTAERVGLRLEDEKAMMDTTTVAYAQTMFGLPIYQAGISVTTQGEDNAVTAASSTLQYGVEAKLPTAGLVPLTTDGLDATNGAYDDRVRQAFGDKPRINRTRLIVYKYEAAKRLESHPHDEEETGQRGDDDDSSVHGFAPPGAAPGSTNWSRR